MNADTYEALIEGVRDRLAGHDLAAALQLVQQALDCCGTRPEAYNALGVIHYVRGARVEAQRCFRLALELDPRYRPAQRNLSRSTASPEFARGGFAW